MADLEQKLAAADLAAIELIVSRTIREAPLSQKQSDRLVEAQYKCRKLVERCSKCLQMHGGMDL